MNPSEKERSVARERILESAYELFSTEGVNAVGVDTIVARSGSGKMTLYRHFKSKDALVLAFLEKREQLWTKEWLETRLRQGDKTPEDRLLYIFDLFDEWFRREDFEGCSFINSLLECRQTENIRSASAQHLAHIRAIIEKLAREAGLIDVERFARAWHVLMKGSIVARHEGHLDSAVEAKATAKLVFSSWPRSRAIRAGLSS
jgi:AcrR family transcriptional regulator